MSRKIGRRRRVRKSQRRANQHSYWYIKFFKPYGVLSQFTDGDGRPTLGDFISEPDVYAVGRLDRTSEGLMLLTDDGHLNHRLTHPRYEHPKTYVVQVEGIPDPLALTQLQQGVEVKGQKTRPAEVKRLTDPPELPQPPEPVLSRAGMVTTWLQIILREGRKRQIRRMTAAVGHPTIRLVRIAIGPLRVGDLSPGDSQTLQPVELQALKRMDRR